jgi:hypothetical protein
LFFSCVVYEATTGRDSHAPIFRQQSDITPSVEHQSSRLPVLHLCGPQKLRPRCKMMEMLSLISFVFFSADCRKSWCNVRADLHIDLGLCHPEPWFV